VIHRALLVALAALADGPRAAAEEIVVLRLDGSIQPASLRYLERGLDEAGERDAELVIVELDTPGGLLVSLRSMTSAIVDSDAPVAVYVTPAGARAASAGFFLLVAADVAAMAPGTNAGAAHPVTIGGDGGEREDADEGRREPAIDKATEDAAAMIRALARARGRSVSWAEQAVTESRSYAADEALDKGLIDLMAGDRAELIRALDGASVTRFHGERTVLATRGARVVELGPTIAERVLMTIADPGVAYLLLMLGLLGLLAELLSPGLIVPGVLGAIAFLLALYAFSVLPVNWVGGLLIAIAIALFVAEAFVTSYGLLALAGAAVLILGSMILFEPAVPTVRALDLGIVLPTALVFAALALLIASRAVRAQRRPAPAGVQDLVGRSGHAVSPLAPDGWIFVRGETWRAIAPRSVAPGTRVRVVGVEGNRLRVQPLEEAPAG
jgi:membrane-bound serine protease (ClpP class)